MAVPKRKTSKSKKRMRRTHKKLSVPGITPCPNCGEMKLNHRVCTECGYYKDAKVVDLAE